MLAHVGSAPVEEVLLVLLPVSLLAGALYLANRRADRALQARTTAGADGASETAEAVEPAEPVADDH